MFGKNNKTQILIIILLIVLIAAFKLPKQAYAQILDTDSDGLSDEAEINTYKTNPSMFDSDSDGFSDDFEVINKNNPLDANDKPTNQPQKPLPIFWYISRISAISAFIVLTFVATFGLIMTSKVVLKFLAVNKINPLEIHRTLAWSCLILISMHFGSLFFDDYVKLKPLELLIPLYFKRDLAGALGRNISLPVSLGIVAFYLIIMLITTSELRNKIVNIKFWRALHYLSSVTYISALTHGLLAGTDSSALWMKGVYIWSVLWVAFWVSLRIFRKQLFTQKQKLT